MHRARGCDGERDCGNGSLMRIVPFAFTDASDDDVARASAITNAHAVPRRACVTYVHAVRALAGGVQVPQAIAGIADTARPFERVRDVARLERGAVRSGGYVVDTLEAALWCLATTGTYASCVLSAVNLGEDTDTTAAVVGALASIVYGRAGIPREWLEALRGKDVIERALG
ncbi:ADP-ribosylglycohydrolase family protein [Enorma phocaeensis]|uniref:ADP-ribosylglycohydrolase family protein n=1 Tax=Enorma phocaeensis TaxID=1871019 RepID=A0ABT7VBC8_9ACTN|nr:ADP-ribosylglycohydrolase family protein [Enorma phocaeensis]MDM8275795.1 ADP-ribosylglycohydrolase family protein [Enorma phocaeensis]